MKNSAFVKSAYDNNTTYVDIYTSYGVSFIKGAYLELLKRSASKGYVKNESRLQHGTDYIAKPAYAKYAEKKISVGILLEASTTAEYVSRVEGFVDTISNGKFLLKIPSLNRIFKLVYSDIKIKQAYRNQRATFTLELIEPNPYDRDTIQGASS